MARRYTSPLTGDPWSDVRPAIGTIIGLANFLNTKRPRRKPPDGHDEAIALATDAAGSFAGIPKLVRTGELEGRRISDAYWQAKDAKTRLHKFVDDGRFVQEHRWRGEIRQRAIEGGYFQPEPDVGITLRAARLAFYGAILTEKATANGNEVEIDHHSYGHDAMLGALIEIDDAGVARSAAMEVERVWRFVVAAGRLPKHPDDDDLLAAFEAALMAGEDDFATNLAKTGVGFRSAP